MSEKRRALGRGLGALIPSAPTPGVSRPTDVFFREDGAGRGGESDRGEAVAGAAFRRPAPQEGAAPRTDEREESRARGPEHSDEGERFTGNIDASQEAATRGGDALGPDALAPVPGAVFAELPLTSIVPNPRQPRQVFDADELSELAHSIREIGVLQPVVVRSLPPGEPVDSAPAVSPVAQDDPLVEEGAEAPRYELIMGERRWRASQEAGLAAIPAIIKDTQDDDLLRDALLENLHRSQLNALEEAAAYQQLLEDFGCTHDELAARIGRSRPQISNTLRLLKLPPLVARRVAAGVLSAGHARALLGLGDAAAMERLAQRIVAEGLSVRSVEEIVTLGAQDEPQRPTRRPRAGALHPQLDDLAARLSDRFDTRVNIALGKRKGKLTVEFASVDDLTRIVDLLAPGEDASA